MQDLQRELTASAAKTEHQHTCRANTRPAFYSVVKAQLTGVFHLPNVFGGGGLYRPIWWCKK